MRRMHLPKILKPLYSDRIIRLGKENDGGYLVDERDVLRTKHLLSFGIGTDSSFERQFVSIANCDVKAFDENANVDDFRVVRSNVSRDGFNGSIPISNIDFCEGTFLKCDIDGGEYEILDHLIDVSDRLTGMVIEFHGISQYAFFNEMTSFIAKTSLKLLHTHPNNYSYIDNNGTYIPDVIELTLSSQNLKTGEVYLPHRLDMTNNPADEDFELTF